MSNIENEMVSVIIPLYNCETKIRICLDSIMQQSYSNIEVIVINDGSTDCSADVVLEYTKINNYVKLYSYDNHGVSWARNKGMDLANGKYIVFVDADDYLERDMIDKMFCNKEEADLIICGILAHDINNHKNRHFIYGKGYYAIKDYLSLLQVGRLNPFFGGPYNKLFLRKMLLDNNIRFDEKCSFAEDFCFNMNVLQYCKSVYVIDKTLYHYIYNNEDSLTVRNYKNLDYDSFFSQAIKACNLFIDLMKKNQIETDGQIWFDIWKIFISKINKTVEGNAFKRTYIINQYCRNYSIKRKIESVRKLDFKNRLIRVLVTNPLGVFLLCVFIRHKHR